MISFYNSSVTILPTLQKKCQAEKASFKQDRKPIDDILEACTAFLESQTQKVDEIEQYLAQYGFKSPGKQR